MKPQDYTVSGIYLRGYLAGLRKLTGSQYSRLLEQCGLAQYKDKYPPASTEIVAKGSQLICLGQAVTRFLDADLFDLFQRNLGREFGKNVANNLLIQAEVQKIGPISGRAELMQVLKLFRQINQSAVSEVITFTEAENDTVEMIYQGCVYCAGRSKLEKPGCVGVGAFHKEMLFGLTHQRYQIDEVHCGAMYGEPDCHFLIRHT